MVEVESTNTAESFDAEPRVSGTGGGGIGRAGRKGAVANVGASSRVKDTSDTWTGGRCVSSILIASQWPHAAKDAVLAGYFSLFGKKNITF